MHVHMTGTRTQDRYTHTRQAHTHVCTRTHDRHTHTHVCTRTQDRHTHTHTHFLNQGPQINKTSPSSWMQCFLSGEGRTHPLGVAHHHQQLWAKAERQVTSNHCGKRRTGGNIKSLREKKKTRWEAVFLLSMCAIYLLTFGYRVPTKSNALNEVRKLALSLRDAGEARDESYLVGVQQRSLRHQGLDVSHPSVYLVYRDVANNRVLVLGL